MSEDVTGGEWRGGPFDEFESEIRRMREFMESLLHRKVGEMEGPFVCGFTVRMGPDGDPVIRKFGSARYLDPGSSEPIQGTREPLTDVFVHNDTIAVTLEIPGVNRDSIDLKTTENSLIIDVDDPNRRYYKEIELPRKVRPDSAKATYKNGVLDVTLEIDRTERMKKVRID